MKKNIKLFVLTTAIILSTQPISAQSLWASMSDWFNKKTAGAAICLVATGIGIGWLWRSYTYKKNTINDYESYESDSVQKEPAPSAVNAAQSIKTAQLSAEQVKERILRAFTKLQGAWASIESHTIEGQKKLFTDGHKILRTASNVLCIRGIDVFSQEKIQLLSAQVSEVKEQELQNPQICQAFKQNVSTLINAMAEVYHTQPIHLRQETARSAATRSGSCMRPVL